MVLRLQSRTARDQEKPEEKLTIFLFERKVIEKLLTQLH